MPQNLISMRLLFISINYIKRWIVRKSFQGYQQRTRVERMFHSFSFLLNLVKDVLKEHLHTTIDTGDSLITYWTPWSLLWIWWLIKIFQNYRFNGFYYEYSMKHSRWFYLEQNTIYSIYEKIIMFFDKFIHFCRTFYWFPIRYVIGEHNYSKSIATNNFVILVIFYFISIETRFEDIFNYIYK